MFIMMNKKSPITILKYLIELNNEAHMREIARKTYLSLGFVSRVLNELSKEELILLNKKGRMKFYCINTNNPLIKQLKVMLTISSIMPILKEIKEHARRIILFGSAARGEDLPDSDIDLFVLTNDSSRVKKILTKNFRIVPIIMNSAEFANFKNKDAPLYEQIMRGIILWEKNE